MAAAEDISLEELLAKRRARKDAGLESSGSRFPADYREKPLSIVVEQGEGSSLYVGIIKDRLRSILNDRGESRNNIPQQPKIPRVPRLLTEIKSNSRYYEPVLVCIGPYHRGKDKLELMEKRKITMAREYVKGAEEQIENLKKAMEVANDSRKYYNEDSTKEYLDDEAFTRMMFVDGCFILQFMICCDVKDKHKDMKMKSHEIALVKRDLFLLENQLPFRVLKALMSLRFKEDEGLKMINEFIKRTRAAPPPVDGGCKQYIRNRLNSSSRGQKGPQNRLKSSSRGLQEPEKLQFQNEPIHLLDFLRKQLVGESAPSNTSESAPSYKSETSSSNISQPTNYDCHSYRSAINTSQQLIGKSALSKTSQTAHPGNKSETVPSNISQPGNDWHSYRSANELKAAGIHIKASETDLFTDVKFESHRLSPAILKLPPMTIDDSTKYMLLNLIAYETCPDAPDDDLGVTSYLCFMDSLIDLAEDVRELRSKGILLNLLGSDQLVADLFNEIATDLAPNPDAYGHVKGCIEEHYKNKIKVWVAQSFHVHFSRPWSIVAFLGVLLTLALTAVQAHFAAHPPK